MASRFTLMPPRERRSAQALLNSWNIQVRRWQGQADRFTQKWINYPDRAGVQISEYLAFSEYELASYQTVDQFRAALDLRKQTTAEKVSQQKASSNMLKDVTFPDGYYVYLVTCYNHGMGAYFMGYGPTDDGDFDPTEYGDWI